LVGEECTNEITYNLRKNKRGFEMRLVNTTAFVGRQPWIKLSQSSDRLGIKSTFSSKGFDAAETNTNSIFVSKLARRRESN
jgi:hypothetical protein